MGDGNGDVKIGKNCLGGVVKAQHNSSIMCY